MKQMLWDFFAVHFYHILHGSTRLHGAKRGAVFFPKKLGQNSGTRQLSISRGRDTILWVCEFRGFESQLSQTWFTRIEDNWQMAWWHDDGMICLGRKVSDDINMLERDGKNKQKAHRKDISRAWKTVTLRLSILSILSTCPFFSANSRRKFKSFRHIVMTAWLHVFWRFVFALHFISFNAFISHVMSCWNVLLWFSYVFWNGFRFRVFGVRVLRSQLRVQRVNLLQGFVPCLPENGFFRKCRKTF